MVHVSVIIPSYRRADQVRTSIESVLAQTLHDLEVIVVDDGSGDGTDKVVQAIDDVRVRYVAHPTNRGGNAARNTGIRHAKADLIAFLDSDDVWEPDKLEAQVDHLARVGPEFGFCTTWILRVDPADQEISRFEPTPEGRSPFRLWEGNDLGGFSTVLVRKEALQRMGDLDESLASCQDWDCYLRLSRVTRWTVVPRPLVRYVDNPGDAVRITSRRAAVISGTRHVFDRYLDHRQEIPADVAQRSLANFLVLFAWSGSVTDFIRVCAAIPVDGWDRQLRRIAWTNFRYCIRQSMRAMAPPPDSGEPSRIRPLLLAGRGQGWGS